MEIFLDYSNWIGLITLTLLEVVLGIDNLFFIIIITNKLRHNQRDKARIFGLLTAVLMRVLTLSFISWTMKFKKSFFCLFNICFSLNNLILISGGIFLIFKAIMELYKRLQSSFFNNANNKLNNNFSSFWSVVIQIVILDMLFSLDAVITAVGIVNNLIIMTISIIIAMSIMLFTSKALTKFININPTALIICLSFLLILGFSLVCEGLGFYVSKSYLYFSISFAILIEIFNYIEKQNFIKSQSNKLIKKIITTNKNSLNSIKYFMTPREKIFWINIKEDTNKIKKQIINSPYNLLPVCIENLDNIIGIAQSKELLLFLQKKNTKIKNFSNFQQPILISESIDMLYLTKKIKISKPNFFLVISNKSNFIKGIITPLDILKYIINISFLKNEFNIQKNNN